MSYQVETCGSFASNSPVASSTLASSTISTFVSPSSIFISPTIPTENNPNLAEKIAIPVGTVVGVTAIGLVSYLIYKKRKSKLLLIEGDREIRVAEISNSDEGKQEIVNGKENSSHELAVAGPSRSQTKEENEQLKEEMQKLKERLERVEQKQGLEAQIQQPSK